MKVGQINLGTKSGNLIKDICKRSDVSTIVEIGTWNGMGSTLCVIDGIKECGIVKKFISIELYENMYREAIQNLGDDIKYVELLNGSIIGISDMDWFDHSIITRVIEENKDTMGISSEHSRLWYESDMSNLKSAKYLIDQIPEKIDFLILDGGEFSSYPEWCKLKSRTRIVALDDSNIFKCSKIRREILDSNEYNVIVDDLNDRNGFSVFEKK
jgi:hypothetical protein